MRNCFSAILLAAICLGCAPQEIKANTIKDLNTAKKHKIHKKGV
jgi:hypothetical protein